MSSGHELLAIEVESEVPWKPLNGQGRKGGLPEKLNRGSIGNLEIVKIEALHLKR